MNEKIFTAVLRSSKYRLLEREETGDTIVRKVAVDVATKLPAPLAKLAGSTFGYTKHGAFERAIKRWSWTLLPNALPGKVQ